MFIPGDRLWVRKEPSTVWWPAKVLSEDELNEMQQPIPAGSDYGVLYYAGTTTEASLDFMNHSDGPDVVVPFETSSEKAVTVDTDLQAAIASASEDLLANPIKGTLTTTRGAAAGEASQHSTAPKRRAVEDRRTGRPTRARNVQQEVQAGMHETSNNKSGGDRWGRFLEDEVYLDIATQLRAATAAKDFAAARRQLIRLDRAAVTLEQLYSTRIGVAVGDILGCAELQGLWPLARAFCSWWAQQLPQETRDAIQYVQDVARREQEAVTSASSALASGNDVVAAAAAAPPAPPSGQSLREKIISAFEVEGDVIAQLRAASSSFSVAQVVETLFTELPNLDHRRSLLLQLQKPGHHNLRQQMLRREITGAAFLRFSPTDLLTDTERAAEQQKVEARLKAIDEASKPAVVTEMFTCKSCKTNRCSFHEQQTRGADEPTTKFITCLNCGATWTEE